MHKSPVTSVGEY